MGQLTRIVKSTFESVKRPYQQFKRPQKPIAPSMTLEPSSGRRVHKLKELVVHRLFPQIELAAGRPGFEASLIILFVVIIHLCIKSSG